MRGEWAGRSRMVRGQRGRAQLWRTLILVWRLVVVACSVLLAGGCGSSNSNDKLPAVPPPSSTSDPQASAATSQAHRPSPVATWTKAANANCAKYTTPILKLKASSSKAGQSSTPDWGEIRRQTIQLRTIGTELTNNLAKIPHPPNSKMRLPRESGHLIA